MKLRQLAVNNFCREFFEKTQKYLREPTPKIEGSKRSSKCSSMRAQIELKMQEEELERQAEAQKKLLEAKLHLKLLQVDEEKRKKVQAAKDKAWLSELDKNSEDGSVDLENDENVQNLKEEWVNRVNKNQDGLAGNVDETTAQQNVIQVDTELISLKLIQQCFLPTLIRLRSPPLAFMSETNNQLCGFNWILCTTRDRSRTRSRRLSRLLT